MWPFKAKRGYDELEEEIRKLKRLVEERDLDWVDMRSRCKRLLDRTEKAARALQPDVQSEELVPSGQNGEGTAHGRLLSPHQMQIQQQILRKRAGL